MNMDQLIYFTAVVEEGTISGAARRLNMSQPPVSLQLKNLEAECGVTLFIRGARQIRLTEAGQTLYDYAVKILDLKHSAEDDLRSLKSGKKGSLRIGIVSSGLCEEFFRGIRDFTLGHPDVNFKIFDGNTYQLLDMLEHQKIELAVIRTPFLEHGLDVMELRRDPITAAGCEQLMIRLPEGALHLSDLRKQPLILYRRWEKIIRECAENEKARLNYYCVNDDARTSIQWAETGMGIALVPASILPVSHGLLARELEEAPLCSTICLVRRRDHELSESALAMYRCFEKIYRRK